MNLWTSYVGFLAWIQKIIEKGFRRVGAINYDYSWVVILCTLIFCLIVSLGLLRFNEETAAEKLWLPQNSQAIKDKRVVEAAYGFNSRPNQLFITLKNEGDLLADRNALLEIQKLHVAIANTSVEVNGRQYKYADVCTVVTGGTECNIISPLGYWNFNEADIIADEGNYNATIQAGGTYPSGGRIARSTVIAGVGMENGAISTARAVQLIYFLQPEDTLDLSVSTLWEKDVFLKFAAADDFEYITVVRRAASSFDEELSSSVSGDITFFAAAIVLIVVYASLMLSRWNWTGTRIIAANIGFLSVGLSILVSFGLSSLFGVFFTSLVSIMPFILIGVGMDNVFVLVDAFDRTPAKWDTRKRMVTALGVAGGSIIVTSLTDVAAFLLGTLTTLPAIRSFCIYAAIGVGFSFISHITFFTAWFCILERAAAAGSVELVPCIKQKDQDILDQRVKSKSGSMWISWFIKKYYAPFLMKLPVRICVIILTAIILGVAIYFTTTLDQGLPLEDLAPDDSYLQDFYTIESRYFEEIGQRVFLYVGEVDYFSTEEQNRIIDQTQLLFNLKWVEKTTGYASWLEDFLAHLNATNFTPANETEFYDRLFNTFLKSPQGGQYTVNVVPTADGLRILNSRVQFFYNAASTIRENDVDVLDDSREVVIYNNMFVYNFQMDFWEQSKVIPTEAYTNLALAGLGVFIISNVLLANPLLAVYVIFCLLMIDIDILGLMALWSVKLNTISVVNLVMAIGFSFDYVGHLAHAFIVAKGTRVERVKKALVNLGASIFNGGFSTLLGVLILSASQSAIFRIFFRQFVGIVIFGLYHGLVFFPVLASFIGPAPVEGLSGHGDEDEDQSDEEKGEAKTALDSPTSSSGTETTHSSS